MILIIKWFNYQSVLWIPISLHPKPSLSLPNELINKMTIGAEMEATHELSNTDFHSPQPILLWLLPSLQPDINTESPIWYYPMGWLTNYLIAGWIYWTTSIMKEAAWYCYWSRQVSTLAMYLIPAYNASAKISSVDLENALSTIMPLHRA